MELNKIYQGHTLDVLKAFPDNSVDMCVTSPPYYGLRKYGDDSEAPIWGDNGDCGHEWYEYTVKGAQGGDGSGKVQTKGSNNFQTFPDSMVLECSKCGAMKCELGQELDYRIFIEHLVWIFREVRRVLKPYGTLWLNIGDSYAGSGGKGSQYSKDVPVYKQKKTDITRTSLIGIPQRLMIALIDDGWVCRNDIVWHKPNGFCHPDKTKSTPNHEHIYELSGYAPWFAKEPSTYYYKQLTEHLKHINVSRDIKFGGNKADKYGNDAYSGRTYKPNGLNVKNSRDTWFIRKEYPMEIWSIMTASFSGAHFAVYPIELPRRAIEAGCPKKICTKCGTPVAYNLSCICEGESDYNGNALKDYENHSAQNPSESKKRALKSMVPKMWTEILCDCDAGFNPGVILDPFMGSGTTALAALQEGVNYIGIELFKENIELADQRIREFFPMRDSDSLWEV